MIHVRFDQLNGQNALSRVRSRWTVAAKKEGKKKEKKKKKKNQDLV